MSSTLLPILMKQREQKPLTRNTLKKLLLPILIILAVVLFLYLAIGPAYNSRAQSGVASVAHTSATVDENCKASYYSRDGNPFQLCPGPFPGGGNCVWWAWEQWHLLGYDLPLNWGNAADWVVDAERTGLPIGTEPRAGAIAVFPRADGVWAYGPEGHVAFVTSVSDDGSTFNVTYQNYGDPTPMHTGLNYPVAQINAAVFQHNQLRFIYFPTTIDTALFAHLPGINGNALAGLNIANTQAKVQGDNQTGTQTKSTVNESRPTLGLPGGSGSAEQEFNADFSGNGLSDLLLYNRSRGSLSVVSLSPYINLGPHIIRGDQQSTSSETQLAHKVMLSDAKTTSTGWGANLDIRVGDFAGTGESDILLYDRTHGTMQMLTLTPQLTIKTHVSLTGWGPNWELYAGRFDGHSTGLFMYNRFADASIPSSLAGTVQMGDSLQQWRMTGRTANAVILDFNTDLSVHHLQQYTQWHNSWEVYVGRYTNAKQDGIFLYDRKIGEARVMDFDGSMAINNYQEIHDLSGNWQVFSGDFNGSGRAQVMLYEPSRGMGAFLILGSDLSLVKRLDYTGWTPNEVFYVGHFGTDRLNAMLYDPQVGTSTFIVFNDALKILTLHTVHSWDQHYQILVGAFVDRTTCLASGNCSKGDDILVLNRATGQIQQYVFTFGRQYQVINNRAQPYVRNGFSTDSEYRTVDTTTFQVVGTFATSIANEELY
ncbi:MAG: hypothetical protein NVS4B1_35600 [Ktedonobacteraceae bacterium]